MCSDLKITRFTVLWWFLGSADISLSKKEIAKFIQLHVFVFSVELFVNQTHIIPHLDRILLK